MHPTATRVTRDVALVVAGFVALALTGCASGPISPQDEASHAAARAAVADLSRGLYRYGTDVIDDYARWADESADAWGLGVELIGYDSYPGAVHGDPFGALQFRATVEYGRHGDPYVACFESEFDFWGVATGDRGTWDDDAAVAHDIECPSDAARVPPPVDARTVHVVPDGTEALVLEVLTNAPLAASADDIVAQVLERMPHPLGEREAPFEPRVLVVEGGIGFAMGDADDCLLVKRDSGGVVVLNVPDILLKPGELGCNPDTALRPEEQLRSPH